MTVPFVPAGPTGTWAPAGPWGPFAPFLVQALDKTNKSPKERTNKRYISMLFEGQGRVENQEKTGYSTNRSEICRTSPRGYKRPIFRTNASLKIKGRRVSKSCQKRDKRFIYR